MDVRCNCSRIGWLQFWYFDSFQTKTLISKTKYPIRFAKNATLHAGPKLASMDKVRAMRKKNKEAKQQSKSMNDLTTLDQNGNSVSGYVGVPLVNFGKGEKFGGLWLSICSKCTTLLLNQKWRNWMILREWIWQCRTVWLLLLLLKVVQLQTGKFSIFFNNNLSLFGF